MILTGLRLTNWMRYRGVHELSLGPGVYAITAEREDDPARSNWSGKSALVSAIRFLLDGTVPTETLNDAIFRGEDELAVEGEFDDGTFIARSKDRKLSAQLEAVFRDPANPEKEVELSQEAAQERIIEWRKLSEKDFLATSFFAQKKTSEFVVATPAARTEIVNGWLELGPLVVACKFAGKKLVDAEKAEAAKVAELGEFDRLLQQFDAETFDGAIEKWEGNLAAVRESNAVLKQAYEEWQKEQQAREVERQTREVERQARKAELEGWRRDEEARVTYDEILAEIAELEKKRGKVEETTTLEAKVKKATEENGRARDDLREKEKLACGTFSGTCPVNGGDCPIADDINADNEKNDELLTAARAAAAAAGRKLGEAQDNLVRLRTKNRDVERLDQKIAGLKERLEDFADAARRAVAKGPPPEEDEEEVEPEEDEEEEAPEEPDHATEHRTEANLERLREAKARFAKVLEEADACRKRVVVWRIATAILGRNGAQRRIAKGSLSHIERLANVRLVDSGIPLTVHCQWGRPTKNWEAECGSCGEPFKQRAKECARCGAVRLRKTDEKLHIQLSDRSGAAEDLGGLAFQLAAARWLRERRGSPWSVLVLDEPFGALDEHNRKALASSLATLVSEGFEQAFVIAHDRGTLDALPNRIRIVAHEEHSTVEVV